MSVFSRYLDEPTDSPEHRQFRASLWLGGYEHECRYYLSVLRKRDFFDVTASDLLDAVREYVVDHACPAASQFCATQAHLQFVLPFLKHQSGDEGKRLSKEEAALALLVQHPEWSDDQICHAVGTTEKAMKRWSTYKYARIAQTHYKNGRPGWC
jgi:hypothetical protein